MSYAWVFVDVKQVYIPRVLVIDFDNLKRLSYYPSSKYSEFGTSLCT
jgi:hypothetical protein